MQKPIFVLFPLLLLVTVSIYSVSIPEKKDYKTKYGYKWELYDSSFFVKFQTVDDILKSADLQFNNQCKNSLEYFQFIDNIIRKRFYHGYSYYNLTDNPIAYFAGIVIWTHLSAIVIPDDILKHPMAACSQQSIVMMEVLKRRNIPYRMVGFQKHYALEAFIENEWRFFDANMEAQHKGKPGSVAASKANNSFYSMYLHVDDLENFKANTHDFVNGEINAHPAPEAEFFHYACYFLASNYLVFFLILLLFHVYHFSTLKKEIAGLRKG